VLRYGHCWAPHLLSVLGLVFGFSATFAAEPASLSLPELIERHAPILRFARGEQYFPVMPFFTAFDGRDNDGDSLVDFADPDEIAPLSGNHWVWEELIQQYNSLRLDEKGRLAVGFYRVRQVKSKRVFSILSSDLILLHRLVRRQPQ